MSACKRIYRRAGADERVALRDRRLRDHDVAGSGRDAKLVAVQLLHPRQLAPFVIVKAADKRALAAATPAILRRIYPKARTGDDRTGWAHDGFLFEALDSNGVPFLVVFNNWRGPHAGGGQWTSEPSLFPFAHG
jgi:hypothetical protein